jgi:hypothetical protein
LNVQYLDVRKLRRFILLHRLRLLAALAVVCIFGLAVWVHRQSGGFSRSTVISTPGTTQAAHFSVASPDSRLPATYVGRPGRVIYPYSVIPGGVQTVQELKTAIAQDPVVSSHYAVFHLSRTRVIRLDHERLMHVSYRIGNQVYWSKRLMKLAKGETVITDGEHTARTRCGNQIAEMIPSPVALVEPTPAELDTPVEPLAPVDPLAIDIKSPFRADEVSPPGLGVSPPETGPTPSPQPPPVLYGPVSANPISFAPPPVTLPVTPPVVHVPEPDTATLLLIAFPALWLFRKRKSKAPLTSDSSSSSS